MRFCALKLCLGGADLDFSSPTYTLIQSYLNVNTECVDI